MYVSQKCDISIQLFSRKVVDKYVHATIPKGNMGFVQYTVPNDCSCRTYFCCFPLSTRKHTFVAFRAILSNFFEEQCTQNHPQYLSGLSRALFPTTFLEIAVCLEREAIHVPPLRGLFTWYRNDFHSGTSSFHLLAFLSICLHDTETKFCSPTSHFPVFNPNEILSLVRDFILVLCKLKTKFVPDWKWQIV